MVLAAYILFPVPRPGLRVSRRKKPGGLAASSYPLDTRFRGAAYSRLISCLNNSTCSTDRGHAPCPCSRKAHRRSRISGQRLPPGSNTGLKNTLPRACSGRRRPGSWKGRSNEEALSRRAEVTAAGTAFTGKDSAWRHFSRNSSPTSRAWRRSSTRSSSGSSSPARSRSSPRSACG